MKNVIKLLSLLPALYLAGCHPPSSSEEEAEANVDTTEMTETRLTGDQMKQIGLEVGNPSQEEVSGELVLQGSIDVPPQNTVSLSFPMGAYVKFTDMLPGTRVRKGQRIAIMEDMGIVQLQQDYLTAKTNLELSKTEFERQEKLNSSKASSDKVFQQAKAQMQREEILLHALAEKLGVIGIRAADLTPDNISKSVILAAPVNGYVSKVNVTTGKYAAPTDVLFELMDPTDVHLRLNVFEKDLGQIQVGHKVNAYTNAQPEKKYAAEVILVNRSLDQNRMAEVHCHFDRYDPALAPGMFMNGILSFDSRPALTVPEEAIVRWENKYYVFLEDSPGTFAMTEVVPGTSSNGRQELSMPGVGTDTRLVVKNAFALLMKMKNTEEED